MSLSPREVGNRRRTSIPVPDEDCNAIRILAKLFHHRNVIFDLFLLCLPGRGMGMLSIGPGRYKAHSWQSRSSNFGATQFHAGKFLRFQQTRTSGTFGRLAAAIELIRSADLPAHMISIRDLCRHRILSTASLMMLRSSIRSPFDQSSLLNDQGNFILRTEFLAPFPLSLAVADRNDIGNRLHQ